jgi:hypothetical protein
MAMTTGLSSVANFKAWNKMSALNLDGAEDKKVHLVCLQTR